MRLPAPPLPKRHAAPPLPKRLTPAPRRPRQSRWGATVMMVLIFLHMARIFFGACKYPRELNWVIGVVLVILTMAIGLTATCSPSTSAPTGRPSSR